MSKKLPEIIELSPAQLSEAQGGAARPTLVDRLNVPISLPFDPISPFARRCPPTEFTVPGGLVTITLPNVKPLTDTLRAGGLTRTTF